MSIVRFKFGDNTYRYESDLHFSSEVENPDLDLGEHLYVEIKEKLPYIDPRPTSGYIHDIEFEDDNGIKKAIRDFIMPENFINKNEEL